jgi:hypothetical protein
MPGDDLDAWFRSHPRLRRYRAIYESQQAQGARRAQRTSWLSLAVLMVGLYLAGAMRTGSWWAPFDLLRVRLTPPGAGSAPAPGNLPAHP